MKQSVILAVGTTSIGSTFFSKNTAQNSAAAQKNLATLSII